MATLFKRISDIVNANINTLLDQIEDPERMIKQMIREMEENISQCKEEVVQAIASEKQLSHELHAHRCQSEEWLKKAQLALEANKDNLARSALIRKQEIDKIIHDLEPAWQAAKNTSDHLKNQLSKLKSKLEEAKLKRNTLIARQHATQARYQLHKTADRFQAGWEAQQCFHRMEDKIANMEARTEALAELDDDLSPLEKEFMAMEVENDVEAELTALKIKVQKHT